MYIVYSTVDKYTIRKTYPRIEGEGRESKGEWEGKGEGDHLEPTDTERGPNICDDQQQTLLPDR